MLNRVGDARVPVWEWRVRPDRWFAVARTFLGVFGASAGAFAVALALLPASLVLPIAGFGLILTAATLALISLASPAAVGASRVTFWDIAGALAVVGLAATGLGESEPVLAFLGRER
jgi:hypothetical protein